MCRRTIYWGQGAYALHQRPSKAAFSSVYMETETEPAHFQKVSKDSYQTECCSMNSRKQVKAAVVLVTLQWCQLGTTPAAHPGFLSRIIPTMTLQTNVSRCVGSVGSQEGMFNYCYNIWKWMSFFHRIHLNKPFGAKRKWLFFITILCLGSFFGVINTLKD